MLAAVFEKKTFHFKQPSGTSRGVLTEKYVWFLYLSSDESPDIKGVGECSIIPGLSPDFIDIATYEKKISELCEAINNGNYTLDTIEVLYIGLRLYPSVLFGLETALLDLKNGGKAVFYETDFTSGLRSIPINGLIWMGGEDFMRKQIEEKLAAGFSCIKMKIGAIDFGKELAILKWIRERYTAEQITLRVDANGAFSAENALEKLTRLAALQIHSIEQPIKAGQWETMAALCAETPLPIALDEELIGIYDRTEKIALLEKIRPQFIILKPSLHGGISGCTEWITLAESMQIPWWMTSALESNVGLNVIAQLTSVYDNTLPQGLGTGGLYVSNTPTSLYIEKGELYRRPE